jgi:hypothetical protein
MVLAFWGGHLCAFATAPEHDEREVEASLSEEGFGLGQGLAGHPHTWLRVEGQGFLEGFQTWIG